MAHCKSTRKTSIKNPVFLDYAEQEICLHWRKFFTDCAYGIFNSGITYKDGVIYHRKNKKRQSTTYRVPTDIQEAIIGIKHFMITEIGEISIDELVKKRAELDAALKQNKLDPNSSWKDIRAPTAKHQLLAFYVFTVSEQYELDDEQATNLLAVLHAGITLKVISTDDIIMEDCRIVHIEGVDADERGFFLKSKCTTSSLLRKPAKKQRRQKSGLADWDVARTSYANYMEIKVK